MSQKLMLDRASFMSEVGMNDMKNNDDTAELKVADIEGYMERHPERVEHIELRRVETKNVDATLQERGARYGDFSDHARICQKIKRAMFSGNWERLSDVQKQALEVIADKIARILSGDPNYDDNWHDIQGYAKLAEDRLPHEANHG